MLKMPTGDELKWNGPAKLLIQNVCKQKLVSFGVCQWLSLTVRHTGLLLHYVLCCYV